MSSISILLPDLPASANDPDAVGSHHSGKLTACSGYVQALLHSSKVDRILVRSNPARIHEQRRRLTSYDRADRVEFTDSEAVRNDISANESFVLQSFTPDLRHAIHLRWLCQAPRWPIAGMTHDLSNPPIYEELMLTLLGQPMPCDAVVCSTQCAQGVMNRLLNRAAEFIPTRCHPQLPVIPLGVDVNGQFVPERIQSRADRGVPEDAVAFLYFGRISHAMKADLAPLLTAFREVHRRQPSTRLMIAGGVWGPSEQEALRRLKGICDGLGISQATRFCTNVTHTERQQLFAAADVLVSPSDCFQESFGLVLLEALSLGLPVIASDFNGYRDALGDSQAGILVETTAPPLHSLSTTIPLEDRESNYEALSQSVTVNVSQLISAMLELSEAPQRREEMSKAGRQLARSRYGWPTVIAQHHLLWTQLRELASHNTELPQSPYWYDYGHIFGDHTTYQLDETARFAFRPAAKFDAVLSLTPPRGLTRDLLQSVIDQVRVGATGVEDLDMKPELALRCLSYLMKHALVEFVPSD